MIVYVNDRLNRWAEWCMCGRRVVGLGFPTQCAYTRLSGSNGRVSAPEFDDEAWQTEQAVRRLDAQLRNVVMVFYLEAGDGLIKSKRLHCSRDTMYARLQRAHNELIGHMNDLAAGC